MALVYIAAILLIIESFIEKWLKSSEHWNYLGVDETLGPVAVSIRREKLEDHKDHGQQYNYRIIFRTSGVSTHSQCQIPLTYIVAASKCNLHPRACTERVNKLAVSSEWDPGLTPTAILYNMLRCEFSLLMLGTDHTVLWLAHHHTSSQSHRFWQQL